MSAATEKPTSSAWPSKNPWRFRLCLVFGLISVATVTFGCLLLADLIAAKRSQDSLRVYVKSIFIDVQSDDVRLDLSGTTAGFNVGIASRVQLRDVKCDLQIPCGDSGSAPMMVSGTMEHEGDVLSGKLSARSEKGWSCLREQVLEQNGESPDMDGLCTISADLQLLSLLPYPVAVQRRFSDLRSAGQSVPAGHTVAYVDSPRSSASENQTVLCSPNLTSTKSEVTFLWCVDAARILDALGGVELVSLRMPSTELFLKAPRSDGQWLVRTMAVDVQDLRKVPLVVGGSATFDGLMDSPIVAGFAELLWYGNLSMALSSKRGDVLGRGAEAKLQLEAGLGSRRLPAYPYFEKAASEIFRFLDNISAGVNYFALFVYSFSWVGFNLFNALGGGALGDAVPSYVLDKFSEIFVPPDQPLCTKCDDFSTLQTKGLGLYQITIKQGSTMFFSADLSANPELDHEDLKDLDNYHATGLVKISVQVADWLQVSSKLRDADGSVTMSLNVTNKDRTGIAVLGANGLDIVKVGWTYNYAYQDTRDYCLSRKRMLCNDTATGRCVWESSPELWRWHSANGSMSVEVLGTTGVNITAKDVWAHKVPFIQGGFEALAVKSLSFADAVGSTVLTYQWTGEDFQVCPPPSFQSYPSTPPSFFRPSKAAMQIAARTNTSTSRIVNSVSAAVSAVTGVMLSIACALLAQVAMSM